MQETKLSTIEYPTFVPFTFPAKSNINMADHKVGVTLTTLNEGS